jgi:uncharacterized protein (TIGR00369 family)
MGARTYEWQDLDPSVDVLGTMSGLEYCQATISGAHPPSPVAVMLGMTLASIERGQSVVTVEVGAHLLHGRGVVHGGIISTLLDTAMAWAVISSLDKGRGFATAHLGIDFVRPAHSRSGVLRSEASIVHSGRRVALSEAKAFDSNGTLVASANSTCVIFDVNS